MPKSALVRLCEGLLRLVETIPTPTEGYMDPLCYETAIEAADDVLVSC